MCDYITNACLESVYISKSTTVNVIKCNVSRRLEFGHPGCVQVHGHTGGSGGVAQLLDHAAPQFLVLFVSGKENNKLCDGSGRSELSKEEDHILPYVDDFTGRVLSVLILHHGEASDGVQQPPTADQVD